MLYIIPDFADIADYFDSDTVKLNGIQLTVHKITMKKIFSFI